MQETRPTVVDLINLRLEQLRCHLEAVCQITSLVVVSEYCSGYKRPKLRGTHHHCAT